MKKLLSLILALMLLVSSMTSCSVIWGIIDSEIQNSIYDKIDGNKQDPDIFPDNKPDDKPDDDKQDIIPDTPGSKHDYTAFTASEKALFQEYFSAIIPFVPNNEYYLEEYDLDWGDQVEIGLNYYTYGNTQEEFNSYRSQFTKYGFDGSDVDEYGDTWYYYTAEEGFYIDLSYYLDEGEYIIDVYVYYLDDGSGSGSGSAGGGAPEDDVITNEGAGLPTGTNGVHKVDFTKADKVKDVTDQGYYLDGCPTLGKVPVLVIPVEFSDVTAKSKGYTVENIERAFYGDDTDYYSVEEYYYISSYGKLDLDFTVVDSWFKPKYSSTYYARLTESYYGEESFIGDQVIMDEALAYLAKPWISQNSTRIITV